MVMQEPEFAGVLLAAQRGDERAFATLWRSHQPKLLRYLRVVVGTADAEDVASATWLDASRSLRRFKGDLDGFRAWLFTIAHRRALDHLRARNRRPATVGFDSLADRASPGVDPDEWAEQRWSTEAALTLIGSLDPTQAEVIALRVIVGLDVDAVGKLVHKSPGAVRVIAHRGLRELASRLEQQSPETTWEL